MVQYLIYWAHTTSFPLGQLSANPSGMVQHSATSHSPLHKDNPCDVLTDAVEHRDAKSIGGLGMVCGRLVLALLPLVLVVVVVAVEMVVVGVVEVLVVGGAAWLAAAMDLLKTP